MPSRKPSSRKPPSRWPSRKPSSRKPLSRILSMQVLYVLLVATVVVGGAARYAAEVTPPVTLTRTLATSVVIPGSPPKIAWPTTGQAAVAVSGLGTVGSAGPDSPAPIASMAKMMTAYLTLQEYPLSVGQAGFTYTITRADVADMDQREATDQSILYVTAGERLTEYQLLEGLLIPSGNNIAIILADLDAHGSVAAFVAKMNAQAQDLGLIHTTYTDPSGFKPTTVSTALDQLRLAQVVMANPVFAQIVGKASVTLPVAGVVKNNDSLVGRDGFVGIKTGSDSQAEGCLAFADHRVVAGQALTIYGVVMGQGKVTQGSVVQSALLAAETLANSVAANLAIEVVVPPATAVLQATGTGGGRVTAATTQALTALGWPGLTERVVMSFVPPGKAVHSGQVLATLSVEGQSGLNTVSTPVPANVTGTAEAAATASMPKPGVLWHLRHLFG